MKTQQERIVEMADALVLHALKHTALCDDCMKVQAEREQWSDARVETEAQNKLQIIVIEKITEAKAAIKMIDQALQADQEAP